MESPPSVFMEALQISKHFSGVTALSEVNFSVRRGEIHALCGENGAGKSTLVKILSGALSQDSGTIRLNGQEVSFFNVRQATRANIACIYQELSIAPNLDVAHNIFLGVPPLNRFHLVDNKKMYHDAQLLMERVGLRCSPTATAGKLSFAQQQMVEICRALSRNASLIIMDEPTSALPEHESQLLLDIICGLRDSGISIIYISHRLDEVLSISDRITVLRDGRNIGTWNTDEVNWAFLVRTMIGKPLDALFCKQKIKHRDTVLRVEQLSCSKFFSNISFSVHQGEILGFFGHVGSGRSELMEAIFGLIPYDSGSVFVEDELLPPRSIPCSVLRGLSLLPENRCGNGLALLLSILNNMTITKLQDLSCMGVVDAQAQMNLVQYYMQSVHIKATSPYQPVNQLSSGNQQKVVLSKWLMMHPKVLILDEPTRGIDISARSEIYERIGELAASGTAVIIVSSESTEILGTCDRAIVLVDGHIAADKPITECSRETLRHIASGGNTNDT